MLPNINYISGVITDGFALAADLRYYLARNIDEGKITLRVSQTSNKVFINSPSFKSIEAHYVCLSWNSKEQRIDFIWRNDKGEVKSFDSLVKLVEDIEKSI